MTMPTPEQAARKAVRIVEVARAMLVDPNNMEKRRTYMQATFNIDWTAAAIVSLARSRCGLCHGVGNAPPAESGASSPPKACRHSSQDEPQTNLGEKA
ncbi:hypothetical protein ACO2Q0_02930 [Phenylobacterium sp. VNQ135]|uniref:hypothetical protein n=1 Tax=Phenylobacterium sp. VNQ135 TaxID=3400922 RepID=UPI003C07E164